MRSQSPAVFSRCSAGKFLSLMGLAVLVCVGGARADVGEDCLTGAGRPSAQWEILAAADHTEVAGSILNPGNLLAQLPDKSSLLEGRLDVKASCAMVKLELSPRYAVAHYETETSLAAPSVSKDSRDSLFLNKALLRFDIGSQWMIEASRQALLWGPSMFFSPSNPFTTDNGRNTPHLELRGEDFVIAQAFIGEAGVLGFYDNVDDGAAYDGVGSFEKTQAISYEHTAQAWSGRLVAASKKSSNLLGGYAQYTMNDYVVIFSDMAANKFKSPVPASQFLSNEKWHPSITAGGAYTFEDGANLSAEYFYNGNGLSEKQYSALLAQGEWLNTQLNPGPTDVEQFTDSISNIGDALLDHLAGLQRHYAAMQLSKNGIKERIDAVLRWSYGIDDGGSLLVADFNFNASKHADIFLTMVVTQGDGNSEFRQFYEHRITLGARVMI